MYSLDYRKRVMTIKATKNLTYVQTSERFGVNIRTLFRWQQQIKPKIIKQATTKRFHYENFEQLKNHLMTFMLYYNHQRPLKSLKFKTPWELIEQCYNENEQFFREKPSHKIAGLNSYTATCL